MRRLLRLLLPALPVLLLLAAPALGLELRLPIDCQPGRDCFVQNYVDRDPGPGAADYRCGPLTYNGHKGTDIRVRQTRMRQGVPVLAAAPGVVLAVRDGMPDISVVDAGRESVRGREAGNSVVVDHGDGYVTQYAHMRQGSVRVKPGQKVAAGQEIGLVGLSGLTEFPHLHLETRKNGQTVDPFVGPDAGPGCSAQGASLWSADAGRALAYLPTIAWAAGFADGPPQPAAVLRDLANAPALSTISPAIVFWTVFLGLRQGDSLHLRLVGPDKSIMAESVVAMDKNQAQRVQIIGKKRGGTPWSPGRYTGTATLVRPGQEPGMPAPVSIQAAIDIY